MKSSACSFLIVALALSAVLPGSAEAQRVDLRDVTVGAGLGDFHRFSWGFGCVNWPNGVAGNFEISGPFAPNQLIDSVQN